MKPFLAHIQSNLRLTMREKIVFFFNYAFPLGFFFMFASLGRAKETNSISQVLTSVLTIGLLGNGFFGGGLRAIMEREANILRRFKVTPAGALPILISGLVVGVVQYLPVVLIMLLVSMGYYGLVWPANWISFFLFVIIANIALRSMGLIIASVANSAAESQIIIQCFYFPMMLLSGATFPISILPQWVQSLAQFIPATHLVSGLQGILLKHESLLANWHSVGALVVTAIACTFISLKLFRWEKGEKVPANAKLWVLAVLVPFFAIGGWDLYSKENLTKTKILQRELERKERVLIRNARLFIGDGNVLENASLLVNQGKIERIITGPAPEAKALSAIEVEAAGKTLLPGLIDAHIHLGAPGGFYADSKKYADPKLTELRLKAYLYSGITTVKSTGDWLESTLALRNRQRSGELLAAELYMVGPLFTAEDGHPTQMIKNMPAQMQATARAEFVRIPKSADEARQMVRDLKAKGVDGIKAVLEKGYPGMPMNRLDKAMLVAICAEAKAQGLGVVVHTQTPEDIRDAIEAGAIGVEHGSIYQPLPDDLLRILVTSGTFYDPTLAVYEAVRAAEQKDFARLDDSLLQQAVPMDLLKDTRQMLSQAASRNVPINLPAAMANLKRAQEAGVKVVTGSDAGNTLVFHGPTVQEELELWVQAGVPPAKALIAATATAAALLGQQDRIGTLTVGKDANLLLVDGNPLQDIKALSRISLVMLRGERIRRANLLKDDE